jgi:hypoxanthine phosphoribosyltransferase
MTTVTIKFINEVWQTAECLYSEEQVENIIDIMGKQVTQKLKDSNPIVISVMNGGMIFTGKLMLRMQFPLELSYIHASRYNNKTTGSDLQWKYKQLQNVECRTVLIVDDILDEGKTLAALIDYFNQEGASKVYSAVLVNKKHDRKVTPASTADFIGLETEDKYLFGYGLDYKGYLRNANGIYAILDKYF